MTITHKLKNNITKEDIYKLNHILDKFDIKPIRKHVNDMFIFDFIYTSVYIRIETSKNYSENNKIYINLKSKNINEKQISDKDVYVDLIFSIFDFLF